MDIMEKLIEICFREFCDLAGDSPCGCDGCPYGKYSSENGECYEEYKNDKFVKIKKTGVTVQEWISVKDRLPEDQEEVLVCTRSKNGIRNIDKGYMAIDRFIHRGRAEVTHWMQMPDLPKGE